MTTWFYYDKNGQKQGPISGGKLKAFTKAGLIVPETLVEAESGKTVPAKKIQGLTFLLTPTVQFDVTDSGSVESFPQLSPFPEQTIQNSEQDSEIYALSVDDLGFPKIPEQMTELGLGNSTDKLDTREVSSPPLSNSDNGRKNSLPLSRAVFIFLAVCVGFFGVHDFYARRVGYGKIHLWLLSPWILVVSTSTIAVFGWTLYAWTYSPLRKEMRESEQTIKECEDEIEETEQKLRDALKGKVRKQRRQPDIVRVESERQVNPPVHVNAQNRLEIDLELVAELHDILKELHSRLEMLEDIFVNLKIQRADMKIVAWRPVGSLWLYFVLIVLPLLSWVMAMFEIVYVTKDGTGQEFAC